MDSILSASSFPKDLIEILKSKETSFRVVFLFDGFDELNVTIFEQIGYTESWNFTKMGTRQLSLGDDSREEKFVLETRCICLSFVATHSSAY
jgi:hypothetical protein